MIALTTYGGDEDIRRALAAGVQAYLTKDVLHDELLKAIRAVHAGQTYLPAAVAAALAAQVPRPDLSARELEVLGLIVQGLANKQIAYSLGIAEHTVKNHVKNILSKLGVQDRTQAATPPFSAGSSTCKPGDRRVMRRGSPGLRPSRAVRGRWIGVAGSRLAKPLPCQPLFLEGLMQEHLHVGLVRQPPAVREALGGLQIPHGYPDGDALGLRDAP